MARSGAERMKQYRRRKQASGLVSVLVYVPADSVSEIRALASGLQDQAQMAIAKPHRPAAHASWLTANHDEPQKAALQVATKIIQVIITMGWPLGHVIGDENELIRRFGVGRSTLREAIRLLEHHGVARMKRGVGGGLVVTEPSLDGTIYAARIYLEFRKVSPSEFLPLRRILEQMALDRALDQLDSVGKERLIEVIEREECKSKISAHEFQRLNRLITELADDPAIVLFMSILLDLTLDRSEREAPRDAQEEVLACHREIANAMLAHDRKHAKSALNSLHDLVEELLCSV